MLSESRWRALALLLGFSGLGLAGNESRTGKENGSYILYWGCIGVILELYWGYIGIILG